MADRELQDHLKNALEPRRHVSDVKATIEAALKRADVDEGRIHVAVADRKVVLSGSVRGWFEKEEARHAAWAAAGVREVEDRITVAH
jgi:osmotically-inducible protein OsmY